jgi:hypothetical protein
MLEHVCAPALGFVHLGPVANEVDPALAAAFSQSALGITPQGWFRDWDSEGSISILPWQPRKPALAAARAVVISVEDVVGDETAIKEIADACPALGGHRRNARRRVY